ncbi:MAG: hypothetical protein HKN29_11185 [Rhodothermales bacterium]|nr:hypothetical protein [Rhodothermales bacterium]
MSTPILRLNQVVNRATVEKQFRTDGNRIGISRKRGVILIWSMESVGIRPDPFARKRSVYKAEGQFNPGGEWTPRNAAIRDHMEEGLSILLFERVDDIMFRFLGRFAVLGHEEMDVVRSGGRGTLPVFEMATAESWLELSLKSADQTLVDSAAKALATVATKHQAESWGPIPLPSKKGQYKSKEQMVETVRHRRRLWLRDPQPAVIAELTTITLPGGVEVDLKQTQPSDLEVRA